jgi:hypothetical protein
MVAATLLIRIVAPSARGSLSKRRSQKRCEITATGDDDSRSSSVVIIRPERAETPSPE